MNRRFYFIAGIILTISSCDQKSQKESIMIPDVSEQKVLQPKLAPPSGGISNTTQKAVSFQTPVQKLIKTVNMRLKVNSVEKDLEYLTDQAGNLGGYVADYDQKMNKYTVGSKKISSDSLQHTINLQLEATMVVKIPSENLEQFLDLVESKALLMDFKTSKVEDVTEKILDLNTRKDTKLRIEKKYISIIENKTGDLKEVLAVEEKIDQIREEIEVMEARLLYLNQQVSMSTIHLNLYQEPVYQTATAALKKEINYEDSFKIKAKKAFRSGWDLFKEIIIVLFYLWPLIIITAGLVIYLKVKKRLKARPQGLI